jgi:hypothetical protein
MKKGQKIVIRKEKEHWSSTGFAFRAYYADDNFPMRIGRETLAECKQAVLDDSPAHKISVEK